MIPICQTHKEERQKERERESIFSKLKCDFMKIYVAINCLNCYFTFAIQVYCNCRRHSTFHINAYFNIRITQSVLPNWFQIAHMDTIKTMNSSIAQPHGSSTMTPSHSLELDEARPTIDDDDEVSYPPLIYDTFYCKEEKQQPLSDSKSIDK